MSKERNKPYGCQLAVLNGGKYIPIINWGTKVKITRGCVKEFAGSNESRVTTCIYYIGLEDIHPDNHSKPTDVTERCPRPRGVRELADSRV